MLGCRPFAYVKSGVLGELIFWRKSVDSAHHFVLYVLLYALNRVGRLHVTKVCQKAVENCLCNANFKDTRNHSTRRIVLRIEVFIACNQGQTLTVR